MKKWHRNIDATEKHNGNILLYLLNTWLLILGGTKFFLNHTKFVPSSRKQAKHNIYWAAWYFVVTNHISFFFDNIWWIVLLSVNRRGNYHTGTPWLFPKDSRYKIPYGTKFHGTKVFVEQKSYPQAKVSSILSGEYSVTVTWNDTYHII